MPSFKKNNRLDHMPMPNFAVPPSIHGLSDKCSVPTICINVSETNNNTIDTLSPAQHNILNCLPEILTDIERNGQLTKANNNLNETFIKGDLYKPYIFGKLHTHTR